MSDPVVLAVHARQWLSQWQHLDASVIDIATVPDAALLALSDLSASHLWLLGAWPTGPLATDEAKRIPDLRTAYLQALPDVTDDDIAGSPYAVAGYRVDNALGGDVALSRLRQRLSQRGCGLILDFVPNHLGRDHAFVRNRPELFVHSHVDGPDRFLVQRGDERIYVCHGKDPYFPGWTDTAQLDYRRPDTREAMIDVLLGIADRCDGVRCDMAMLLLHDVFQKTWAHVPTPLSVSTATSAPPEGSEFWQEAIARVKSEYPRFVFIAEAYWGLEGQLKDLGFDFVYDKTLYDRLAHDDVTGAVQHVHGMGLQHAHRVHFVENHDEPRAAATFADWPQQRVATALSLALPGAFLWHDGQQDGARAFARVQLRRKQQEPLDRLRHDAHAALVHAFTLAHVRDGHGTVLQVTPAWEGNPTNDGIIGVWWTSPRGMALVVVNLWPHAAQGYLHCQRCVADLSETCTFADALSDAVYVRAQADLRARGMYLDLAAHAVHVFVVTATCEVDAAAATTG